MFIKLLVYFYIMIQLPINYILMGLITYYIFEAQINYMWSLKEFKVSETLHITIFYTICSPNFPQNWQHHTMYLPKTSNLHQNHFYNWLKEKIKIVWNSKYNKKIQRTYIFEDQSSSSLKL
jgi:hypothetical protein